jgi:hypothetical protein
LAERELGVGETWVNRELVKNGWAWHYKLYSTSKELADAEVEAREAEVGLWQDNAPIPPWDWRKGVRGKGASLDQSGKAPDGVGALNETGKDAGTLGTDTKTADPAQGGDCWLNTNSGVRHNKACKYFKNTSQGRPCGPNEGRACGVCGG